MNWQAKQLNFINASLCYDTGMQGFLIAASSFTLIQLAIHLEKGKLDAYPTLFGGGKNLQKHENSLHIYI